MNAIFVISVLHALYFQPCLSVTVNLPVAITDEQCQIRLHRLSNTPEAREIQILMDISSVHACIGMCRLEAMTEHCNAVVFSTQKTSCILLELGIQFPIIYPVDDSFGRYIFGIESCNEISGNRATYASIYPMQVRVPVLLKTCEMYKVESGLINEVFYPAMYQDIVDLENCVLMCEMRSDKCIGVYYTHAYQECRLLEETRQNKVGYKTEEGTTIAFIQQCVDQRQEDDPPYNDIPEEFEQREYYLPVLKKRCTVKIAMPRSVKNAYFEEQREDVDSIENCMTLCLIMNDAADCDAIFYLEATHTCTICKLHQDQYFEIPDVGSFAEFLECFDAVEEIEEQPDPEDSVVEEIVHHPDAANSNEKWDTSVEEELYLEESNEICTLQILHSGQMIGYKELENHSDIGHFRTCLFLCRLVSGIENCTALRYTQSSRSCSILTKNDTDEVILIHKKDRAFDVKSCEEARHPDGMILRKPFKVFIYSYSEICQIMPYAGANVMVGWKYIARDTITASFEKCVEICRILRGAGCEAITFNEKMKCATLEQSTEENSIAIMEEGDMSFRMLGCHEGPITELLDI